MTTEILEATVVKLKPQEIEIQNIDHLGIVPRIIDSIGISKWTLNNQNV